MIGEPEVNPNIDLVLEAVGDSPKAASGVPVPLEFDDGVGGESRAGGLAYLAQHDVDKADGDRGEHDPRGEFAGEFGKSVGPTLVCQQETEEDPCFPA